MAWEEVSGLELKAFSEIVMILIFCLIVHRLRLAKPEERIAILALVDVFAVVPLAVSSNKLE
jgi:hypothetical protein